MDSFSIIYSLFSFGIWLLFSYYYVFRLNKFQNLDKINIHIYNSIPSIFTTLGVLGTFLGIFKGLNNFDVNQVTESIPKLLEGMKTAFITSIIGIILSIIFKPITQLILKKAEKNVPKKQSNELVALSEIVNVLTELKKESKANFQLINEALIGDSDKSISTQFHKLKNQLSDNSKLEEKQNQTLDKIQNALVGNEETSLLTQFEKLRSVTNDSYLELIEHKEELQNLNISLTSDSENSLLFQFKNIQSELVSNRKMLFQKFDEFGELLKKNNTEALVEVMKKVTETFNAQMSKLIEKLVQENFKELNNSVNQLNVWQKENKEMISSLTNQFKQVTNDFEITSTSIKDITENTSKLTNKNSHLTNLIKELQSVMIEDTKFQEVSKKLVNAAELVEKNTKSFDKTTNKLNDWILKEHEFKQSVDILISRLHEVEKIKDINGEFWKNTKNQMEQGVSIISNASIELRNNLDNIAGEFVLQLNETLTSLDELIQRLVRHYV
ncbi:MotA/TolQ/ExbB proton channel family protein [Aureivirga marina]|uniref:MotA/TolQ/ExbB proton channel family protein n=1 Tax=Aureivirga marina TaxID=1182451 RepID=UPI0018C97354|nr:MotA/TolQ/ExbB proton channel family protein [Aureivirga marina]